MAHGNSNRSIRNLVLLFAASLMGTGVIVSGQQVLSDYHSGQVVMFDDEGCPRDCLGCGGMCQCDKQNNACNTICPPPPPGGPG